MFKWLKKIGSGGWLGIGIFAIIFYFTISEVYQLAFCARYTIGEPIEIYGTSIKHLKYVYYVNNKRYERGENYLGGEIGRKYYVKFSYVNPRFSDFLQDMPVPDSITLAPTEGWEKIPEK